MIFKKLTQPTDEEKMRDKSLPIVERKKAFQRVRKNMMNPVKEEDFNPETFDPMKNHPSYEMAKRVRREPTKKLPTMGMKPKELLEGQMIGMFESKQDLYLMIAHVNNTLIDKIEKLEAKVEALKTNPPARDEKISK